MGAPKAELLKAIELALAGDWDAAHELVQLYEDDEMASWIHAVLHKQEGDLSNSRYWYRRAKRTEQLDVETKKELEAIKEHLKTF